MVARSFLQILSVSIASVAGLAEIVHAQESAQWSLSAYHDPAPKLAGTPAEAAFLTSLRLGKPQSVPQAVTGDQSPSLFNFFSKIFGGSSGSVAESACPDSTLQEVQSFKGSQGFPKELIASAQRSTVRISFQDNEDIQGTASALFKQKRVMLRDLPEWADQGVCTGTLIARNFVLTAGHCVDSEYYENENASHTRMPRVLGRKEERLSHEELGRFLKVDFNHQIFYSASNAALFEAAGPQESFSARVVEVYESDYDSLVGKAWRRKSGKANKLDFAILRLDRNELKPWVQPIGLAKMVFDESPRRRQRLAIIQHPMGGLKKVGTGSVQSFDGKKVFYADLTTEPGSSGAGVLTTGGKLLAIHTRSPESKQCNPDGSDDEPGWSANQGQKIAKIQSILQKLLAGNELDPGVAAGSTLPPASPPH